jgi:TrmH family RNA methyltransferase
MEKITSAANSRIKAFTKLHTKKERDRTGLFLIEGEHLLGEALQENIVETIFTDAPEQYAYPHMIEVTPEIMKKLSSNVSAVHLIAVCRKQKMDIHDAHRLLLLDEIQDPGNFGTLIRTAVSFGFDGVVCSENTVDLYNDKTIRSTQGAMFHMPILYTDLSRYVRKLQQEGFQVIATSLHHAKPMMEIEPSEKMAFIMGNEGNGVSERLQELSDERLFIEMKGFESLNVAVAGGIVMYRYHQ